MAGKQLDVDKIQLEVTVDGSPARKELAETKQEVAKLKSEYSKLQQQERELIVQRDAARAKGDKGEVRRLQQELAKVRAEGGAAKASMEALGDKAQGLREKLGAAGLSANELRGYIGRLKGELNSGVISGTDEEVAKIKKLEELEAQYRALSTTQGKARLVWEKEREGMELNQMSLRQLGLELDRWEDIKSRSKPETAEYNEASAAITRVKERTEDLTNAKRLAAAQWEKERQTIALTTATVDQLALEEQRLQAILANPNTNAADRRKAAEDLKVVQDRTEQLTDANRIARDVWEEQRKEMKLVEMSVQQLGLEEQRLKAIINSPTTSDSERQQAARHLETVIQRTKELTDINHISAKAWEEERKSIDRMDMSLEQLGKETVRYKEIQRTAQPNSAAYAEATAGLAAVKDRTEQLTNASRMAADEWVKMRGKFRLEDMSIQQLKLEKQYLDDLRGSLQRTDPALKAVEQDFIRVEKALKDATEQTALQERQWERMRGSIKLTDMSIEELEQEVKFLNAALNRMKPGDTGLDKLRRDAQAAEGQLAKLKTGLGPFGQMWQSIKSNVLSAGAVLGGVFAGGALMQGIRSLVTGSGKLTDELAEVQKVTGLTADQVQRLNTEISHIDTRTATTDLRGIAVGLGQAGQEVTGAAVEAIDKINLALGSEFGASAKEITNTVSVLRNNLSDVKSGNYAEDVGKIGNAILVLGQSGLATAPVVSDIGNRIAGVARQFGVSSGQILGTAASFQELGISTERGSTAYTKLLQKMSVAPQAFADVVKRAGGDADEFIRLVNTDMQAAFLMMAQAARTAGDENTEFGAILKELETSGAGVSELLSKVGANTDLFAKKAAVATEALKNQNAITEQAATMNNTLGAQLDKLGKLIARVFHSQTVVNWVKSAVGAITDFAHWVRESASAITFWAGVLLKGVSVWAAYRAGALASTLASKAWAAAAAFAGNATAVFTGKVSLATRASNFFAAAWKTNPLGLVISALTTAYGLFTTFRDVLEATTLSIRDLNDADQEAYEKAQTLYYQISLANKGTSERRDLINQLKELYPGYLASLDADTASNEDITRAMEGLNAQLIQKIALQKLDAEVKEQADEIADAAIEKAKAEADARKLATELARKYGLTLKENGTLAEKLADLQKQLQDAPNRPAPGESVLGRRFQIEEAIESIQDATEDLTDANHKGMDLEARRAEIVRGLTGDFLDAADAQKKFADAIDNVPSRTAEPYVDPGSLMFDPRPAQPFSLVRPAAEQPEAPIDTVAFDEATATVGELDAKVKALKAQLKGVSDPEQGKKIMDLIARYKQLRDALAGGGAGAKQAKADIEKHTDELRKLLSKAHEDALESSLTEDEKELQQLRTKQAEELRAFEEHTTALVKAGKMREGDVEAAMAQLQSDQIQAEMNLLEKQGQEREAAKKAEQDRLLKVHNDLGRKIEDADRDSYKRRLQDELAYWDEAIKLAEEKGENTKPLQRNRALVAQKIELFDAEDAALEATKFYDELKAAAEKANQEQVAAGLKATFDIAAIEAQKAKVIEGIKGKSAEKQLAITRDLSMKERAIQIKRLQDFATMAQGLGSITSAIQQNAEAAADADGQRTKAESARIRRIALLNIAVQTATAIANGVASAMSVPFPGNLAAAATTIATVIGLMGQASALMGSAGGEGPATDNNPYWNNNNLTLTGEEGIPALPGPSHGDGGLDVMDTTTGRRVANIEGGEAVVNKEVTAKNPELIDELMAAAKRPDKKVNLADLPGHPDAPSSAQASAKSDPVRSVRGNGIGAPHTLDGGRGTQRMEHGGLVQHDTAGTTIPTKKQRNPGVFAEDGPHLKDVPELRMEYGGVFKGSLHRDGGNSVIDNRTGEVIAEVEKDEPWLVLSRAFREKNSALIPTLLEASRRGLRLEHINTAPIPVPNPQRVAQAMRIAHFAGGGMLGTSIPVKKQRNPGADNNDGDNNALLDALGTMLRVQQRMVDQNEQLINRLGDVNEGVRKFPKSIRAYTVLNKEHDRKQKQWDDIKERYAAG